ncbi:MAG: fibronectin type III domain-containing protein, partial [Candidatus Kaiserbacteria bacterium]|nr:fibronectin type III domain-containing protein [Candidatus Kaiserbacteria bacterium]
MKLFGVNLPITFIPLLLLAVIAVFWAHAQTSQTCSTGQVLQTTDTGFSCVSVGTIGLSYGNKVQSSACDSHQVLKITDAGLSCVSLLSELLSVCGAGKAFFYRGTNVAPVCRLKAPPNTEQSLTYTTAPISQQTPGQVVTPCGVGRVLTMQRSGLQCVGIQTVLQGFCNNNQYLDLTGSTLTCSDSPPKDVAQVPGIPNGITKTGGTETSMTISWNVDDNGSPIDRSQINQWNTSSICVGASDNQYTVTGSSTSETITRLQSQTYYFQIRARNGVGWGSWSACTPLSVTDPDTEQEDPECGSYAGARCSVGALSGTVSETIRACPGSQTGTDADYEWICVSGEKSVVCSETVNSCSATTCASPPACGSSGACETGTPTSVTTKKNACPIGQEGEVVTKTWSCTKAGCPATSCKGVSNTCQTTGVCLVQPECGDVSGCASGTASAVEETTGSCAADQEGNKMTQTWSCSATGCVEKLCNRTIDTCYTPPSCGQAHDTCTVGVASDSASRNTAFGIAYTWTCTNAGHAVSCEELPCGSGTPPSCDYVGQVGSCSVGTASQVTPQVGTCQEGYEGVKRTDTWTCTNSGCSTTCEKQTNTCQQVAVCDTSVINGCSQGTLKAKSSYGPSKFKCPKGQDGSKSRYLWTCEIKGNGSTAYCTKIDDNCVKCGTTAGTCAVGTASAAVDRSVTCQGGTGSAEYKDWTCAGAADGFTKNCSKEVSSTCPAAIQCSCDETVVDGCSGSGCSADNSSETNACTGNQTGQLEHTWVCDGASVSHVVSETCTRTEGACVSTPFCSCRGTSCNCGSISTRWRKNLNVCADGREWTCERSGYQTAVCSIGVCALPKDDDGTIQCTCGSSKNSCGGSGCSDTDTDTKNACTGGKTGKLADTWYCDGSTDDHVRSGQCEKERSSGTCVTPSDPLCICTSSGCESGCSPSVKTNACSTGYSGQEEWTCSGTDRTSVTCTDNGTCTEIPVEPCSCRGTSCNCGSISTRWR